MPIPSELYREIPLTKGQIAIVDKEDYPWLIALKWHADENPTKGGYYAAATVRDVEGKPYKVYMHRLILGLNRGDKRYGDHKDPTKTLDNRRSNLRISTASQNQSNRSIQSNNRSGFKGVMPSRTKGKWIAQLKSKHLGTFPSPVLAYEAYCRAAHIECGEFARTQ